VIDEVERRAPDGFSSLADVIDPAELEKIVSDYARASGQSAADLSPADECRLERPSVTEADRRLRAELVGRAAGLLPSTYSALASLPDATAHYVGSDDVDRD
jgi:hypothetical protein